MHGACAYVYACRGWAWLGHSCGVGRGRDSHLLDAEAIIVTVITTDIAASTAAADAAASAAAIAVAILSGRRFYGLEHLRVEASPGGHDTILQLELATYKQVSDLLAKCARQDVASHHECASRSSAYRIITPRSPLPVSASQHLRMARERHAAMSRCMAAHPSSHI